MRPNLTKKGIRVLGIAESFNPSLFNRSVLAGVVMRGDLVIDGTSFSLCTVSGMDATDSIINMFRSLNRDDINYMMVNGCVISLFNVIDLNRLNKETGLPLVCITYDPSDGLREHFKRRFPEDWQFRVKVYESNGAREEVKIKTGYSVYLRSVGISSKDSVRLINRFTVHGRYAEPIRVAKLLAKSVLKTLASFKPNNIVS